MRIRDHLLVGRKERSGEHSRRGDHDLVGRVFVELAWKFSGLDRDLRCEWNELHARRAAALLLLAGAVHLAHPRDGLAQPNPADGSGSVREAREMVVPASAAEGPFAASAWIANDRQAGATPILTRFELLPVGGAVAGGVAGYVLHGSFSRTGTDHDWGLGRILSIGVGASLGMLLGGAVERITRPRDDARPPPAAEGD